jgi:Uri superfamily endonuclease
MKGSYVLLIEVKKDIEIVIGKLGKLHFKKGFYVYVGSALNSLEYRINRHVRTDKKIHWHIDYLLKCADIVNVFIKENSKKEECRISYEFEKNLKFLKGFGCSDCKCNSHLFYGKYNEIINVVSKLKLKKYNFNENT